MSTGRQAADAWARYAGLITAQIAALEGDEIELLDQLGREREQAAREIERIGLEGADPEAIAEVRRQMAGCVEADAHLRQQLDVAHQENVMGTRRVDRWRKALNMYSRGLPGTAAIDVKL